MLFHRYSKQNAHGRSAQLLCSYGASTSHLPSKVTSRICSARNSSLQIVKSRGLGYPAYFQLSSTIYLTKRPQRSAKPVIKNYKNQRQFFFRLSYLSCSHHSSFSSHLTKFPPLHARAPMTNTIRHHSYRLIAES